jgi:hypothetical protein
MSVISLPERGEAVRQAVDRIWSFLEAAENIEDVRHERKKAVVKTALEGLSDEEVWAELESRKLGTAAKEKSVKVAELETLIAAKDEIGEDRPEGIFFARSLPRAFWDKPWMQAIERVVLVHRLREVVAQVGFTRFEAAAPDTEAHSEDWCKLAAEFMKPSRTRSIWVCSVPMIRSALNTTQRALPNTASCTAPLATAACL